jgi:hypothetical protein
MKSDARAQQHDADQEWPMSPSAQALEELAAELAEFLGQRQKPGLERLPSSTWRRSSAQDPGLWRDQLLAEIEDLAGDLKRKVARYASLRAVQSSPSFGARTGPADVAAVAWIYQTLEDIAATALGLEIASREVFLRAGMAEEQNLSVEAAQEQAAGTAE